MCPQMQRNGSKSDYLYDMWDNKNDQKHFTLNNVKGNVVAGQVCHAGMGCPPHGREAPAASEVSSLRQKRTHRHERNWGPHRLKSTQNTHTHTHTLKAHITDTKATHSTAKQKQKQSKLKAKPQDVTCNVASLCLAVFCFTLLFFTLFCFALV